MPTKTMIFLIVLFLIQPFPAPGASADQTVFGPRLCKIGWWHFHLSSLFVRSPEPSDGSIVLHKNTPDRKIRGGVLILNGRWIPICGFLRGKETNVAIDVRLRTRNRLILWLQGAPRASISLSVRAKKNHPAPMIELSASPASIVSGNSATLSWSADHADSCMIEPGIGAVAVSGSIPVAPTETTTYFMTAEGSGGTATDAVTVTVNVPNAPPELTANASPETIAKGGASLLLWNSTNADSAHIDHGVGLLPPSGSTTVAPDHTTTYTVTVTGPTGTASATVTIHVTGNPAPLPEGSFGRQYEDQIPPDANVDAYDPDRFSIVAGRVQDATGAPLPGVAVTIFGRPDYGTARTGDDGRFSLPAEGGGTRTVVYRKQGWIATHRKVEVGWNEVAAAPYVVMLTEDPASSEVVFDGDPDTVVAHRSTPVSDAFGTRSTTLVFTGDNPAILVDETGADVQTLTRATVRATEFSTPESMPAILPPNSAYTYCSELQVDGVDRVRFSSPVIVWVDNFLGFAVGEVVPVGYYDRDIGQWVPSDNGVVVRLLDRDGDGVADAADADDDGSPDDIDASGSFRDEVTGLTDPYRYPPGATFWRYGVSHFSPVDANFPPAVPEGAKAADPNTKPQTDEKMKEGRTCPDDFNSFVEARSRIYHEDISVPGTDATLHYASDRVTGYGTRISVPASGATVPPILNEIVVKVSVAGRQMLQVLPPLPDQIAEFTWDGSDHLGRQVQGTVSAQVDIGYVYNGTYARAGNFERAFGQAGGVSTGVLSRQAAVLWQSSALTIFRSGGERHELADGWTLSPHHDAGGWDLFTLYKGDGKRLRNTRIVIDTVAGNGTSVHAGDGGPATAAGFASPARVIPDPAGGYYITEYWAHYIRHVDADGTIITVAGTGTGGYNGDGGPAVDARLNGPWDAALDARGNLYVADTFNHRIRKIDPEGNISTVAGTGTAGYSGDGGPAASARLSGPFGIDADHQGNLYIVDGDNCVIRKVDPEGRITTVAGNGTCASGGDSGPAAQASFYYPSGVVADNAGNLFVVEPWSGRIRKVDAGGTVTTVAGDGDWDYDGDGGPATAAKLCAPIDAALDDAGNLYIADLYNNRIRKVDGDGIIDTVAGNGAWGFSGDGSHPTLASLDEPHGVAVDPAGKLLIADTANYRIRKVDLAKGAINFGVAGEVTFSEEDGTGHILDSAGRHRQTVDLATGTVVKSFEYDAASRLVGIADVFGNRLRIERDGYGVPTAVVSPDGLRTDLFIDADRHLTRIVYPDGAVYDFVYTADGLMTAQIEPEGNRFDHGFDGVGRLTDLSDEEGGHWHYDRTVAAGGTVTTRVVSAEGVETVYEDFTAADGAFASTITGPAGQQTLYAESADGMSLEKSLPCGMHLRTESGYDPAYGFKRTTAAVESTPSGLIRETGFDVAYADADTDGIADRITGTLTVNGKTTQIVEDALAGTVTVTSSGGRAATSVYDPATLLTESVSVPGLFDTFYDYDSRGRLTSVQTHSRTTGFTYDADGFLQRVTDPLGRTTIYTYDDTGRMTGVQRPDGSSLGFTYDKNGNATVLTHPLLVAHQFGYDAVNRNSTYGPPLSGIYRYGYDRDRRLVETRFPSGMAIVNVYHGGRLTRIDTPEGAVDFTYRCGTTVDSIAKGAESIVYDYDGRLIIAETLTGTLNQVLGYAYNDDFNLSAMTYAGVTTNYTFDADDLLTGAGPYTIGRSIDNGLPESVGDGTLALGRTFNGYGEVAAETYTVAGADRAKWAVVRDDSGRIVEKTETVAGITTGYAYTYDSMGRLLTVTQNGGLVEEYEYDATGLRVYEMNQRRGIAGRSFLYDAEDRLLTAGTAAYRYDADGFLTEKTDGANITTCDYSSRGELLSAALPDGTLVEYRHDPLGRRIAKVVNGVTVEKYLWQGLTRLLAVYDGADALLMRFSYADGRMPASMTAAGSTYYLTYDQVGSLRLVADAAGTVVKKIEYDSFGNILSDSNPAFPVPFGFAGGLHDRDTALVRFGFRDYDPDIGRWTAKDPILFGGGDADLYGYVQNNAVNFIDPFGLEMSDVLPGIQKAIVEGAKGGAYATVQAVNGTADIAINGHPLAQAALGVALVSEAAPLIGAVGISAYPSTTAIALNAAPYSEAIVDFTYGFFVEIGPPKGWGYLSSGALTLYDVIKKNIIERSLSPCEN